MRILVLTDEIFPDAVSGIGKSVYNELAALSERGHSIHVIVRSTQANLPEYDSVEQLSLHRIAGFERSSPLYFFYPLLLLWKLIRVLHRTRETYDVLIVYNPIYLFAALLNGIARRTVAVQVFYSPIAEEIRIQANRGKYGRLTLLARLAASLLERLERFSFQRADMILVRSRYSSELLHRTMTGRNVHTMQIAMGLNIQHYQPQSLTHARQKLDLPENRRLLITVRRLVARVGLENLIRAMQIVRAEQNDVLLLISGEGYLRTELEMLIQQLQLSHHVQLLGFIVEDTLPLYLAAADLFVLPTEQLEGFGLATIEALAVGLPVVGTPVGATPEILQRVHPELLTRDASPAAIAATIIQWMDDEEGRKSLRRQSRQIVEQHYDANAVAEQLEKVLMDIVAARES